MKLNRLHGPVEDEVLATILAMLRPDRGEIYTSPSEFSIRSGDDGLVHVFDGEREHVFELVLKAKQ